MSSIDPNIPPENPPSITVTVAKAVPTVPTGFVPTMREALRKADTSIKQKGLEFRQEALMFFPHPKGLEELKKPDQYPELKPYGVTERVLVTDTNLLKKPSAEVTLWEKKAEAGQPHYIMFNGRTGHWADTGATEQHVAGYDRHAGLKLLEDIAKSGAGFTVVTLRGYGNNKGRPSEEGFRKDIQAILDDWMGQEDRPPAYRLIVSGNSMGTACASIAAAELTKRGEPPALLALSNPFSSMTHQAMDVADKKHQLRLEEKVMDRILRHPFRTDRELAHLTPQTQLMISTSANDTLIDPLHSQRLVDVAKAHGLQVEHEIYPDSGHITLPVKKLAQAVSHNYEKVLEAGKTPEVLAERMAGTRDGVYRQPKLFTVTVRDKKSEEGNGIALG